MVSFVMRALTMFLGYVYPAYECFKSIEKNRRDSEEQTFWCQYWVLIAVVTFIERITDVLVSWLPMYNEVKLAFIVYLWYPKTKGTNYIYTTFFKPFVANYEPEIDRKLQELRAQAGEMAYLLWQRVSLFTQAKFFELVHCLASPQIRLQAYKRHLAQLHPVAETLDPSSPTYYSRVVIQEESDEDPKGSVITTSESVTLLRPDQQQVVRRSTTTNAPAPHRTEREPASSFFRTTTRSSKQPRATYVRVP